MNWRSRPIQYSIRIPLLPRICDYKITWQTFLPVRHSHISLTNTPHSKRRNYNCGLRPAPRWLRLQYSPWGFAAQTTLCHRRVRQHLYLRLLRRVLERRHVRSRGDRIRQGCLEGSDQMGREQRRSHSTGGADCRGCCQAYLFARPRVQGAGEVLIRITGHEMRELMEYLPVEFLKNIFRYSKNHLCNCES